MDTYRLTCIPDFYEEENIRLLFSEADQILITGSISLATSVYAKNRGTKTATVTFRRTPSFAEPQVLDVCRTKTKDKKTWETLWPSGFSAGEPNLMADEATRSNNIDCPFSSLLTTKLGDAVDPSIRIDNNFEGMTPLIDSDQSEEVVDIIALTGIAGRAFGSWQHSEGQMWLRDSLSGAVPNVRVLLWGQRVTLEGSHSHLSIQNLRDLFLEDLLLYRPIQDTLQTHIRPLILMGHSLGGIIVKAAFIKASKDSRYRHLYPAIHGLVYFATPHDGMETKYWDAIWGNTPAKTLIRDLTPGSSLLAQLKEDFFQARMNIDVLSCIEREESPTAESKSGKVTRDGPMTLYVSESSSCTSHAREEKVYIKGNHSTTAKLSVSEGSPLHTVLNHLKRIVRNSRIVVGHADRRMTCLRLLDAMISQLVQILQTSGNMNILAMAVKMELDDMHRLVAITEYDYCGTTFPKPFDAHALVKDDLSKASEQIKQVFGFFYGSSDTAFQHISPHQTAGRSSDLVPNASLQNIFRTAVPHILALRQTLDEKSLYPSLLERFCSSDAAKQLGLHFESEGRLALEGKLHQELPESKGRIEQLDDSESNVVRGRFWAFDGADAVEVILEYRSYFSHEAMSRDKKVLQDLEDCTQMLATYLKLASTIVPDGFTSQRPLSVLKCVAWKHDQDQKRFVLIYEPPRSFSQLKSFRSLQNRLAERGEWPLDRVFFTAYQLTLAIFDLHMCGWLHKNLNPSNIILLPPPSLDHHHSAGKAQSYPLPILRGFEFSRKQNTYSDHLASIDKENNIYRHPNRQGIPTDNASFQQHHDIYAVGTILFELGRNKTIKEILLKRKKGTAEDIKAVLLEETDLNIPSYYGTAFASCVKRCLSRDFGKGEDDKPLEGQLLALAFRRTVVDELKRMAFACGAFVT